MRTFTDTAGHTWTVNINVDAIKRVRAACKINLWTIVDNKENLAQLNDPVTLVDVIFVVCSDEATARTVDDVAFAKALGGDALEAATNALMEALVDFFPKARRMLLSKVLEKGRALETIILKRAETSLENGDLEAEAQALLAPQPQSEPSGSSPASSESMLAR